MKTAYKNGRSVGWYSLSLLALGLTGCDLGKTTSQLTAKSVAVATILATPAVDVKLGSVALPDAGVPAFDGGLLADAGVTVPAQTAAFLFFGQRQSDSIDVPPVGLAGAKVTLTEVGGKSWALSDVGSGNYQLAGEDAGFAYKDNATYDFTIVQAGLTYVAEIAQAPALERITQFHPSAGYVDQVANAAFTFTRPEPASGVERTLGFETVFPLSADGSKLTPTYTNVPMTPVDFLKLVLAPQEWKVTQVTIPGSAFPNAGSNYLIVHQSVKLGGPKSDNLFTGSAILGGTADVAVVKTR